MVITFPHLGDVHIAARLFMKELGVDLVVPPLNCQEALKLGAAVSPEEICFPFKLMAGNLIQAWEMGADTVVMPATMGPCRLGEYAELLNSVLRKSGCDYDWIVIDSPSAIGTGETLRRLTKVVEGRRRPLALAAVKLPKARNVVDQLCRLEAKAGRLAGYLNQPRECKYVLRRCKAQLMQAGSLGEAIGIIRKSSRELDDLPLRKEANPVKIILTGEIYTLIEPFANRHIEEILMDLGVSLRKRVTVSWWITHTIEESLKRRKKKQENAYLAYSIGGYARETVEEAFSSAVQGFDGVLQLLPMGCMPEIVAKSVLGKMSTEMDLKVLTILLDEMDGEAGYVTRVEAFVDMLERAAVEAG